MQTSGKFSRLGHKPWEHLGRRQAHPVCWLESLGEDSQSHMQYHHTWRQWYFRLSNLPASKFDMHGIHPTVHTLKNTHHIITDEMELLSLIQAHGCTKCRSRNTHKLSRPNSVAYINHRHLYLSGGWIGSDVRRHMFETDWTTAQILLANFRLISLGLILLWADLLMAHCQWPLIIHNNLIVAPKLTGIDPGFFRYTCRRRNYWTSWVQVV